MSQFNVNFNAKTGLSVPDTDAILNGVQEEFKKAFGNNINLDPSSPQGQLIASLSAMLATKNTEFLKLANQFNPLTAQGVFQNAIGRIYFLERKKAQPTVVHCDCMGLTGTVIPAGALVESSDGVRFYSAGEHIIGTEKKVTVEFICAEAGEVQVQPHSVNKIITVVAGWDTVDNPQAGIIGRLEETQAEFERRRYASVAKNAHGTVASLYGSLASIDNVVDVLVLENRANTPAQMAGVTVDGHSVFISVFGGTDAEIAEVVYNKLGCGCGTTGSKKITHIAKDFYNVEYSYNITRPQELPIYINVQIKETDTTPATIDDDIKKALIDNFNGVDSLVGERVKMGENLYASRFYPTILNQYVQELLSVEISDNNADFGLVLFINADKFPTLSKENIKVTLVKKV